MTQGGKRRSGIAAVFALALVGCATATGGDPKSSVAPDKVIYHISDAEGQAVATLRNIKLHLDVNPLAKIVVVTHARGVDFLFEGAKDRGGNPYDIMVEELNMRGVKFDVCETTMRVRELKKERFISGATFVPLGVAEITRLQQREGYAYIFVRP